jgi:hypothetical protein
MSIYQEIWDADQSGSGVPAILPDAEGDPETGYVRVAAVATGGPDLRVLPEVVIPPAKLRTYELVRALFDNYALPERDPETETPQEREEVHNLLSQIVDSAPMQVARRFVEVETGTVVTTDRWYSTLLEMWFRTFSQGGDPSLSGFEHVVVGEQEGAKVQGYHFWYKYFLDDGFAEVVGRQNLPGFRSDQIVYVRGLYQNGQERFPESVTISYRWDAPDYERQTFRPLTKPVGGFFVGCSIEGLMALGTVRAHLGARAPKEAVINGARYDLKVFRSDNNKHLRTFYPVFLGEAGAAPQPPVVPEPEPILPQRQSPIRLIAALVNPLGDDPGQETVTLINTSPRPVSLEGWFLLDAMNNRYVLPSLPGPFPGGALTTITLPRNSIQLSNRGGEIRLLTNDGVVAHKVSYTRDQAAEQGRTLLF